MWPGHQPVDAAHRPRRQGTARVRRQRRPRLRTPLAAIRALAEYGLNHADPKVWRAQLARIAASEERASRLVEQLLALALADEARDSLVLVPVRIDELVQMPCSVNGLVPTPSRSISARWGSIRKRG